MTELLTVFVYWLLLAAFFASMLWIIDRLDDDKQILPALVVPITVLAGIVVVATSL